MKYSLTLTGLIVAVLSFLLPRIGISVLESDLATTITTITTIVGGLLIYIGRYRKGGITLLGVKK